MGWARNVEIMWTGEVHIGMWRGNLRRYTTWNMEECMKE
jgi:hypothetical protein